MTYTHRFNFRRSLLACLLLASGMPGLADEVDTTNWVCKLCVISSGWFGEWDLGLIYSGDPTLRFADYRGMDEDGAYLGADGDLHFRGEDGAYFDFSGRRLGLDSRGLDLRGGKQGKYEFRVHYNETPRFLGHGTQTPFSGVGSGILTLPASWAYESGVLTGLDQALTPVSLESKRKAFGAGLTVRLGSSWKYRIDFERQTRDGTRAFSGGVFAVNAALFPAPIDYTTEQFDMGLVFTGQRSIVRFGFSGSDFNNGIPSVTWDNPFALGFGSDFTRSALEPGNEFYQFSLAGSFRFSPRFRVSGKASVGEVEQDEPFLPYSTNPAHADLALPRDSLDGKLETSMFNLSARLHARLAAGLDLAAYYKVKERDNQTPINAYTPVLFDIFQTAPRSNRPYSYERSQGRLELRFRPKGGIRFTAGLKRDSLERTFQSVRETEEDSFWGEFQLSPWAMASFRLKFDSLERSATPYEQLEADSAENPLMRKFNLAERDRERATIEVDLTPTDRFSLSLSYYTTEDDYDASVLGLTGSEEDNLSVDLNFLVSDKANLYAFFSKDQIESRMSGAVGDGATPWNAFSEDDIRTWGIGFSGRINERISWGLDHVTSESEGDIVTDSGAGEAPFPVLRSELRNTRIYLQHQVSEHWGWGLDVYREDYDSSDWMVDGIGPDTIATVLTMGEVSPDYDVKVVRLSARYRF